MKNSEALDLFTRVNAIINDYFLGAVQINFMYPLDPRKSPDIIPDAELDRNFLDGMDKIPGTIIQSRHTILLGIIRDLAKDEKDPDLISELRNFERAYRPQAARSTSSL